MNGPVVRWALRQNKKARRLKARNQELTRHLRSANETAETAIAAARGWQTRAESLLLIADPVKAQQVLRTLADIASLEEVEP